VPAKKPQALSDQRPQPFAATAPNEICAYHFVFDGCGKGQKLKCLTLIDEFTKESLAIDVAGTIRRTRQSESSA
jgi:putative transposase